MAHSITNGPIKILKCVTPGCYWVKCANCHGTSRVPVSISHKPYSGDFYPPQGSPVFVHDSEGFFYRGTICGQQENLDYTVQLRDTFQVKDFRQERIYPTFGEDCADCESAHMVSLHNTLPALPPDNFGTYNENPSAEVVYFERKVRDWDSLNRIAEEILWPCSQIKLEVTSTVRGSTYGRIFYYDMKADQENTLARQIIFLRIAKSVSQCFEETVEALMSYPLYRNYQFLPHVFPYGPTVPISKRMPKRRTIPSEQLIVHEDDEDFYLNIINQGSFVLMLSEPPKDTDTIVRFVTPDGLIVLAAVAYAQIHYCIDFGNNFHETMKMKRMLNSYLRRCVPLDLEPIYLTGVVPSDWESDDDSGGEPTQRLLQYDFDDALRRFASDGGSLELFTETRIAGNFRFNDTLRIMFANLDLENLRSWQQVMLPFLVKLENVAIIGPKASKKLTTSLISVLTSMSSEVSNPKSSASISPRFIVFVPNFHRADHVARLCLLLSAPFKVITLTTIRFSATQQKDALGSDVIVTTPGNWLKLCNGSKTYFDTSRLEFVLYDCFEKLCENDLELNDVFNHVLEKPAKRSIQTIILSNNFCPNSFSYLEKMASCCVCTIDRLVISFSADVKPTVVFVSDDWDGHLIRIFETDIRSKRLLLCSDHCQVAAIESKTSHLDDVLFIHENLSNQQILDTLELWRANEKKILVSSDVVYSEMEFTNEANLLISWNLNSREKLIKRLSSFSDHSQRMGSPVSVYMFCDRNDLSSLIFVEDALLGAEGITFFNGNLSDLIKLAVESQEKCLMFSKYCPDFLSLGTCYMENCNLKHVLDSRTVPKPNNPASFLKIKSIKFHTAYHITGHVEDIIDNQTCSHHPLLGLRSRSAVIDDWLSIAFKKPSTSVDLKKFLGTRPVFGVKLVQNDQVVLRRARISSSIMDEKMVEVEFLDVDVPNKKISIENIFQLPKIVQAFPPDLVHIYLTELKPTYPELDWCYETTSYVKMFVKLLQCKLGGTNLSWLVGPVKATVDRQLLVNSFYPCNTIDQLFVAYTSVKGLLLFNDDLFVERSDDSFITSSPSMQLVNQMDGLSLESAPLGVPAVVSSYHDPGLIYIQLLDNSDSLHNFESRLNDVMENDARRLPFVVSDELCAVKREGLWNRAIVFQFSEPDLATVRYIDYGDSDTVNFSELFCLPTELANPVPPYSVECRLAGIRPKSGEWDERAIEAFSSRVWDSDSKMVTLNVKFCGIDSKSKYLHLVTLMDPAAPEELSINQWLVKEGKAKYDILTSQWLPR